MKFYLIGGLGADERVFIHLKLRFETEVIPWLSPFKNETLKAYAKRLVLQIDQTRSFGILGVSFGGIVAQELAHHCDPRCLIIISSVVQQDQLPALPIKLGRFGLLKIMPRFLMKPPFFLMNYLFSSKNSTLLKSIIKDTDPIFIQWALNQIVRWRSKGDLKIPILRIHGTNDRLIPLKGNANVIKDGGHFMVVDRAEEINTVIDSFFGQSNFN